MNRHRLPMKVILLVLAGASLRALISVLVGLNIWTGVSSDSSNTRLANILSWMGAFADGQGVLLLFLALSIMIWCIPSEYYDQGKAATVPNCLLPKKMLVWLSGLFVTTAFGEIVKTGGDIFSYNGADAVSRILGQIGFNFSYFVMLVGGYFISMKLINSYNGQK